MSSSSTDCNLAGELQLIKVHQQLPVSCRRQDACRCSSGRSWLVPTSEKGDGFLGGSELLCPRQSSANGFSNVLEDLVISHVLTISKCPCTATEDVFQGSSLETVGMLVSLLCPMYGDLTVLEARHTLPG